MTAPLPRPRQPQVVGDGVARPEPFVHFSEKKLQAECSEPTKMAGEGSLPNPGLQLHTCAHQGGQHFYNTARSIWWSLGSH